MSAEKTVSNGVLHVALIRLEERLASMSDDMREVKELLSGANGRAGLIERTTILEQLRLSDNVRILTLEERSKGTEDRLLARLDKAHENGRLDRKHLIGIVVGVVGTLGMLLKELVTRIGSVT